jgi:hypothetical protein
MSEGSLSRGFRGRRQKSDLSGRIPPGQYLERGFPVLSAGPTRIRHWRTGVSPLWGRPIGRNAEAGRSFVRYLARRSPETSTV